VEALFGHQDSAQGVHALRNETCVSVGGRDKTARFWKVADETQLVFRGGGRSRLREVIEGGALDEGEGAAGIAVGKEQTKEKRYVEGSLECVAMIDEATFVSGGDSGYVTSFYA
jgi:ribosomal RNA-processing protein 9